LKPASVVLEVGVLVGVLIAALRDPDIRLGRFLLLAPQILLPGIVIFVAWTAYGSVHLPNGLGTHFVLPFAEWQWHHMSSTLPKMLSIIANKGFYFGMMFVLSALSFVALFRYRSKFDRFTLIVGCTFVGYNLFLVFAYLAIFRGYTSLNALSYWRYNMHLAHLGVICAAFGLGVLWKNRLAMRTDALLPHLAKVGVVVLVVLPLVFAPKIRFDVRAPKQFVNKVGTEMRSLLPKDSRVYIVDVLSTGSYAKQMRYLLFGAATFTKDISVFSKFSSSDLSRAINNTRSTHVWMHTQNKQTTEFFNLELPERHAHLMQKQGNGWKLLKSWPYPGYEKPQDIPD